MENLSNARFVGRDFSGQTLRSFNLSGSKFDKCNFDNADLSMANCSRSDFSGSTFRNTVCYRTDFSNAKLAATVFEPVDCFGMTITMECSSFLNMRVDDKWFYCWLLLGTLMLPQKDELREMLMGVIGAERYVRLRQLFARREI